MAYDQTNRLTEMSSCSESCPVSTTLRLIGGKWKIFILWQLNQNDVRFTDLVKLLPGVSKKVLTDQLKELERDGFVHRKVYPEVPPKVEYSLSEIGKSLQPVIDSICDWGTHYLKSRTI